MLRKILALTVAVCVAMLLMSADALAWGCGRWSRSGSVSYTGRYGNTYSRSYSGSGYHYGGYYGGGGGYYGGGFTQEVSSPGTRPESIISSSTNLLASPVVAGGE